MTATRFTKEMLAATGLNQNQFAKKIGVHPSTVSNWLKGTEPLGKNKQALEKYLKMKSNSVKYHK